MQKKKNHRKLSFLYLLSLCDIAVSKAQNLLDELFNKRRQGKEESWGKTVLEALVGSIVRGDY